MPLRTTTVSLRFLQAFYVPAVSYATHVPANHSTKKEPGNQIPGSPKPQLSVPIILVDVRSIKPIFNRFCKLLHQSIDADSIFAFCQLLLPG